MIALTRLHAAIFMPLERAEWILPTLARFLFAAVLAVYFWVSALTKLITHRVVIADSGIPEMYRETYVPRPDFSFDAE